jgi:hypothetical protein
MSLRESVPKMLSDRPKDRPMIPNTLHKILQEVISCSWVPAEPKRPLMEIHWKRMREVEFKLLPGVEVDLIPLAT